MRILVHIIVLARDEIRTLLFRTRAVLALLLHLGMILLTAKAFLTADSRISEVVAMDDRVGESLRSLLHYLGLVSSPKAAQELLSWPLALPLLQFLLVIWLPSFVTLVSCDMVSTDLSRGTLRFLLNRTSRTAYFLGKLTAHLTFHALLQAMVFIMFIGASAWLSEQAIMERWTKPALTLYVLSLPFLFFLLAVTALMSCLSKKPFTTMLFMHLAWVVIVGVVIYFRDQPFLNWHHFLGLIVPFQGLGAQSFLVLTLWGVGLSALGTVWFRAKEV